MTRSKAEQDEMINQHRESIAKLQADVSDIGNKITSMLEMLVALSAKDRKGSISDLSSPKVEDLSSPYDRNEHGKQIHKEVNHLGEQHQQNCDGNALEHDQTNENWISKLGGTRPNKLGISDFIAPEHMKVEIASINL